MKYYQFVSILFLGICLNSLADEPSTRPTFNNHDDKDSPGKRVINKDPRLVFVLKISGDTREEIEVKPKDLLGNRIYERHETKLPVYDKETKKTIKKGTQVLDITESNAKFSSKPRRALKVGSVVPGSWLGDNSGQNYVLTNKGERFVDRFEVSTRTVSYTMLHMYDDYCEEFRYAADGTKVNPH